MSSRTISSNLTLVRRIMPIGQVEPPPEVGDTVDLHGPGWLETKRERISGGWSNWPGEGMKDLAGTYKITTRRVHGPVPKRFRALSSGALK